MNLLDTTVLKVAVISLAVSQTLIGLAALAGFWGVLAKKLALIKTFVTVYAWQIGVNLGLDIFTIFFLYKRSPEDWNKRCEDAFSDKDMQNSCKDQMSASKIGTIVSAVISLLFQLYCVVIVAQYGKKLEKEKNKNHNVSLGTAGYVRAAKHPQEADAFVAQKTDYAYSDSHNAFGNNPSHRV
jgi:hypothetical protein